MHAAAKQQQRPAKNKKRRTADMVSSSVSRPKKKSPLYNRPQNYYAPTQGTSSMSPEELSRWRKEQRKKRNRESASISRNKNKLMLEKLEGERDHYKLRCQQLEDQMSEMQERIARLQQAVPANVGPEVATEASVDSCRRPAGNNPAAVTWIVTSSDTPNLSPAQPSTLSNLPSVEKQASLVREHITISRPA